MNSQLERKLFHSKINNRDDVDYYLIFRLYDEVLYEFLDKSIDLARTPFNNVYNDLLKNIEIIF